MTLLDWCTSLGSASQSENLCLGGYGGGSSGGGSGGSSGSGSGGSNVATYIPPRPDCPCGYATWENGNSGEAYGAAIGGYWQCPSIVPCVPEETYINYVIPAVCVSAIMGATGGVCAAAASTVGGVVCGIAAGWTTMMLQEICPSFGGGSER